MLNQNHKGQNKSGRQKQEVKTMITENSNKCANINPIISIITLNINDINGLNAPIKRHRFSEWIKTCYNYALSK